MTFSTLFFALNCPDELHYFFSDVTHLRVPYESALLKLIILNKTSFNIMICDNVKFELIQSFVAYQMLRPFFFFFLNNECSEKFMSSTRN